MLRAIDPFLLPFLVVVRNSIYDECILEQCVVCPYGKIEDCTKCGVVYQVECLCCHALYVRETGRALGTIMAGRRRGNVLTPP